MNVSVLEVKDGMFEYNNGLCHGGRRPRLLFVTKDGIVYRFFGSPIDKICSIKSSSYNKNGKWSSDTYRIQVGTAVPVLMLAPLHGKVWNAESSWEDVFFAFETLIGIQVHEESLKKIVREEWPDTAARFDAAHLTPPLG